MTKEYETLFKLGPVLPNKAFDVYTKFIRAYRFKHYDDYEHCSTNDLMVDYYKQREDTFERFVQRYYLNKSD